MIAYPKTRADSKASGGMYYKTGKACVHGHISKRLTSTGQCCDCLSARSKKMWKDPDIRARKQEQLKKYISKKTDKEHQREYRQRPEVKIRISKTNKASHARLGACPDYREKKAAAARKWVDENRGRHYMNVSARRHKLRARGSFTRAQITDLIEKQKGRCANPCCNKKINQGAPRSFHIDHIYPVSKGGSNDIRNIQILCPHCNLRKHAKCPYEWAKEAGRLI